MGQAGRQVEAIRSEVERDERRVGERKQKRKKPCQKRKYRDKQNFFLSFRLDKE